MIRYEVTLEVNPDLADALEHHMRRVHIPMIVATGCFWRVHFARASSGRFRTSYEAASMSALDRYLRDHAPALRAEFSAEFPAGVTVTREVWTDLETWSSERK
jgi:hypothetical protein